MQSAEWLGAQVCLVPIDVLPSSGTPVGKSVNINTRVRYDNNLSLTTYGNRVVRRNG